MTFKIDNMKESMVKYEYFKGIFSGAGKNKGEEENEIIFKTIKF